MDPRWQVLRDAGVPLALPQSGHRPSALEIRDAVRAVIATPLDAREREALASWLLAWRHGWPTSFAALLDAGVEDWARAQLTDPNRYLKLRRIAMERLASLL